MTFSMMLTVPGEEPIIETGEIDDHFEPVSFLKAHLTRFLHLHSDQTWTHLHLEFEKTAPEG